jgi:flagellar export protein FliJ
MKRFAFRLEDVLKVRHLKKKLAQRQLMESQAMLQERLEEKLQVQDSYQQSFRTQIGQWSVQQFQSVLSAYRSRLQSEEQALAAEIDTLSQRIQRERFDLGEKQKAEKVLETLREKQAAAHRSSEEKKEQREMEELELLKRGNS